MVEIVVVSHLYDFRHALKLLRAFQPLSSSTKSSSFFHSITEGVQIWPLTRDALFQINFGSCILIETEL